MVKASSQPASVGTKDRHPPPLSCWGHILEKQSFQEVEEKLAGWGRGWSRVCHLDTHPKEGAWLPSQRLQWDRGKGGSALGGTLALSAENNAGELQGAPLLGHRLEGLNVWGQERLTLGKRLLHPPRSPH